MDNQISALQHNIPLALAIEMTTRFREQKDTIINPDHRGQDIIPISETFNRDAIDKVLAQPGCAGIRIYYSMDAELLLHAIIVGVNEKNEDMLHASTQASTREVTEAASSSVENGDDGEIVELAQRCPPDCPPPSELNP